MVRRGRSPGLALVLVMTACASPADPPLPADAPPPPLVFRPEPGTVFRFRRIAEVTGVLRAGGEIPKGAGGLRIEVGMSMEALCRVGERDADGATVLDAVVETFTFRVRSPVGSMDIDSRRPETYRDLPKGHPVGISLEDIERITAETMSLRVRDDGIPVGRILPEGAEEGKGTAARGSLEWPVAQWAFGALPFGPLPAPDGRDTGTGPASAGFPHPMGGEALAIEGSWSVVARDPATGRVSLSLEGTLKKDAAGGHSGGPVPEGTVKGEAVWDAARRIVVRSLVVTEGTLREPGEDLIVDMTARFEDVLLE